MPKEVNPVVKLFKWEDYHDGYMITFHPQSAFPRFDDIVPKVRHVWRDDFEIDMPPGERLELMQPEDVPVWRGQHAELIKMEVSDGIGNRYSDVLQGVLGDCWFMSALTGLAISGRLSEVISRYDDHLGVYEFKLQRWDSKTRQFSPLFVCVDRRVPIIQGHKAPAYCYSSTPGELWPSLLEKAFAKAIRVWKAHPSAEKGGKGFSCMDGGLSALGVAHLLGGESGCYWVKEGTRWDREQCVNLAQLFADLFEKGVFINVNFKEVSSKVVGPKGETRGHRGLVAGHSYSVLRLEFFNVRGQILRLLQLRNPWGKSQQAPDLEWTGDWSDRSPLWRQWPEAAQICLYEKNNDGVFWISIEDLAENMDAFEICDAPLRVGAVTTVRSKLHRPLSSSPRRHNLAASPRFRPSNELGARMADDYLRRSAERAEYERKRLEHQLQLEREQRVRLEAELEAASKRPKPVRRTRRISPPAIDVAEGESTVVVGSPSKRSLRNSACSSCNPLQRQRQQAAEALDAADGVIDGKYFGKQILTTSASASDMVALADAKYGRYPRRRSDHHEHHDHVHIHKRPSPRRTRSASPVKRATSPPKRTASPPRRREYESWDEFDSGALPTVALPTVALPTVVSTVYSGGYRNRLGGVYPMQRSWVSNEVLGTVSYRGPTLVNEDACRVVGAPTVTYGPPSVVRDASVVRPVSYVRENASIMRGIPAVSYVPGAYAQAHSASIIRDVPVTRYIEQPVIPATVPIPLVTEAF